MYGYVDVALPETTRANLKMDTRYGEIFVSPDLKFRVNAEAGMVKVQRQGTGKTKWGGDLNIDLSSNYGKIYLRKKIKWTMIGSKCI